MIIKRKKIDTILTLYASKGNFLISIKMQGYYWVFNWKFGGIIMIWHPNFSLPLNERSSLSRTSSLVAVSSPSPQTEKLRSDENLQPRNNRDQKDNEGWGRGRTTIEGKRRRSEDNSGGRKQVKMDSKERWRVAVFIF